MKKYNILKLILVGVITIMTAGCSNKVNLSKQAEEALQIKYNESFTVSDFIKKSGDYYTVYASSKNYPDITFYADVNSDGKDVSDTYAAKRLGLKISNIVNQSLKDFDGEYFVYSHPMIENFYTNNADISIEDFVATFPSNTFDINVYVDKESQDIEKIYDLLSVVPSKLGAMKGSINVCLVNSGLINEIKTAIEETDDLTSNTYKKLVLDSQTVHISFENGTTKD